MSKKSKVTESFTVKAKDFTARAWIKADQGTVNKLKEVMNELKEKHDREIE